MTVVPWLADWNRRHTFGPGYGPHARWHGTSEVVGVSCSGLVMLWLIIRGVRRDRRMATAVAALLPLLRYGPFNATLVIPGTSPDEEGGPPIRLLGPPASLLTQDALIALALGGYWLERRAEPRRVLLTETR
ncbi:hypothetical protein [Micromonospora musae]|uniref:hypothetical protein n=1 Tax=Micromonospora musae TaxID=1894970 RepID=UPI00340FB6A8